MSAERCWAALPAAGIGRRMGGDTPKQYLPLAGRLVIEHTLERVTAHADVAGVVVALRDDDPWWPSVRTPAGARVMVAAGGAERCHSVLACLDALRANGADDEDWVLVHDAVRPCLRRHDLARLLEQARAHGAGALLAAPVRDTMKRADPAGSVLETVDRERLWHAYTPQVFRLGGLREALAAALAAGRVPTDEAQAVEWTGVRPRLVEGHVDNIKITRPQDLALAARCLAAQAEEDAA